VLELERTRAEWARKSELPGLDIDLDAQVAALRRICTPLREEYLPNTPYKEADKAGFGPGYGSLEAQALHAVVRHYKPSRIIEVGSGVSTHCMLHALAINERDTGRSASITCIEPNPWGPLRQLQKIKLIEQRVQSVPWSVFQELGENDLLFIDSSHTVKPGSDVNYLVLEVLPRLRPGVVVHIHDIQLPFDYRRQVLKTYFHWNETSLVRAFLVHNSRARILFCMSQLHFDRPGVLRELFPEYQPQQITPDGLVPDKTPPFTQPPGDFPSSLYVLIS
jgi:predicted O-methyltransferase YrrM